MIFSEMSKQLEKNGLPRGWQFYVALHALFSLCIMLIGNELLLNISNIILTSMVLVGLISGLSYHKNPLLSWGFFASGFSLIFLAIALESLVYFGFKTDIVIISSIEEIGEILISLFFISFLFRHENEFSLHGFTISYGLFAISLIIFFLITSPDTINKFINDLHFTQQLNTVNLFISLFFLSITILNHTLCRSVKFNDFVRIFLLLFLSIHFGMESVENTNIIDSSTMYSRISWVFYQLSGSLAIAFILLEKHEKNYNQNPSDILYNRFMWSSSIIAIVAIPLGIIIRNRLGFPPISTLVIGITSFALSSIVIWRFQKTIRNISQHREELKAIAYTDPLTGLHNYHGYLNKLSRKNIENLLVISLNIEDFKSINDLHGRDFGDDVLKSLAKRLAKTPGVILVARTGSDYFQAVFRISMKNMPRLVEDIKEHLGIWDTVNNRRIAVPLTFGASYGKSPTKPESLARQAEEALKVSRSTHTNFTLYSELKSEYSNHKKDLPRHELREILQKAVDDNYLPIHFQPIYDLNNGDLKALELLIRVKSDEHGLLLPGQFLDQAKAYGLLTSLTRVCVNMVAKCYSQLPNVTININVPPYMLSNTLVLKEFINGFKEAKLPMECFCVEVTEDGDIPTDQLIPAINLLRSHGFKIAMDDFGTGYSSLARLSVLPVDVVKIDRSLLLAASAGNKSILESAISLTKRLGVSTVVEGVETLEQLSLIRQLGADSVQGFLLSKPVKVSKAALLSLNAVDIVPEF